MRAALNTKLPHGGKRVLSWKELGEVFAREAGLKPDDLKTPEGANGAIQPILGRIAGNDGFFRVGKDGKVSWDYFEPVDSLIDTVRRKAAKERTVTLETEVEAQIQGYDSEAAIDARELTQKVKDFCKADPRLEAALHYLEQKEVTTLEDVAKSCNITVIMLNALSNSLFSIRALSPRQVLIL